MLRLSPLGAARLQLARATDTLEDLTGSKPTAPLSLSALERFLEVLARPSGLNTGLVHMAGTLARWTPNLDDEAQRALVLLVLASLHARDVGSTRLPVLGEVGASALRRALADLLSEALDPVQVKALTERVFATLPTLLRDDAMPYLIGRPGDYKPLILDGPHLYHQRLHIQEQRLALAFAARIAQPESQHDLRDLARWLDEVLLLSGALQPEASLLSPEQQYALLTAAHRPFVVVSGGPGTGKTSIIISMLRLFARIGHPVESIALAAPTGKAAKRMQSTIQARLQQLDSQAPADLALRARLAPPTTLHRLLGFRPGANRFRHNETNPLPYQLVIVDEASMIDLAMMDQLLRATPPHHRLILLGDADQLPSVDAGAVLRDIVPKHTRRDTPWRALVRGDLPDAPSPDRDHPMAARAVRLEHSFRMDPNDPAGRDILLVARQVLSGQLEAGHASLTERETPSDICFQGVELLALPSTTQPLAARRMVGAYLERWFRERVCAIDDFHALLKRTYTFRDDGFIDADLDAIGRLRQHLERFRVLCLAKRGPSGVDAINEALHACMLRELDLSQRITLCVGEPVMMLHNDYERQIFNGDQGIALKVRVLGQRGRSVPRMMLVFPKDDGYGVFHPETLRGQFKLAHAITVHKSQGSEFDEVTLILPERDGPLLTRELIYTAMTRSRRAVVVLADPSLLALGIRRQVVRHSGLAQRIRAAVESPDPA